MYPSGLGAVFRRVCRRYGYLEHMGSLAWNFLIKHCIRQMSREGWKQAVRGRAVSRCDFYFLDQEMGKVMKANAHWRSLRPDQAANRLPLMEYVTLKTPTTRLLQLLGRFAGADAVSFYPRTFCLPDQLDDLLAALGTAAGGGGDAAEAACPAYILKPSRGFGPRGLRACG